MPEIPELFLYTAAGFMVWALKRIVAQLDSLEKRVRVLELRQAGMLGRRHLERATDLEEAG